MRFAPALALLLAVSTSCGQREGATPGELTAVSAPGPSAAVAEPSAPEPSAAGALVDAGALAAVDAGEAAARVPRDAGAAAALAACPEEMAHFGKFCVDRHEAHLVLPGVEGGPERALPHCERPPEGGLFEARSAPGVFPQAYVSRVEAELACQRAGKRLCTLHEWRRACRGPGGRTYPRAGAQRRGACSSGKPHLLSLRFGSNSRLWKYDEHFNSPELALEPGFLARTGEHPDCATEEGVHDLVGNLHEWVKDTVTSSLVERLENDGASRRKQPWATGNGVFAGGFFSTGRELGPGCLFTTIAHEPSYHDYSTGFRCCASARAAEADAGASPAADAGSPPR